nr:CPBP family intramembrane glutamic endopeptidase [uncultured Carboxylicivirga sp.]
MNERIFPSNVLTSVLLLLSGFLCMIPLLIINPDFMHNADEQTMGLFYHLICITIISVALVVNYKRISLLVSPIAFKVNRFFLVCVSIVIVTQLLSNFLLFYFKSTYQLDYTIELSWFMVGAIVGAPIFEEFIFRGIILKGLLQKYSPMWAIALSTLLFALLHPTLAQLPSAIIFGALFGFAFYKTKSIGLTIVLHFVANTSSLLIKYWLLS